MKNNGEKILNNANKAAIFRTLIQSGPMSRISLSKQLGLNKMSVTNYTNELLAENLVHEIGTVTSDVGRKPILLDIAEDNPLFVALQITRFYISVGICNCKGKFQGIHMSPIEATDTSNSIVSKILASMEQLLTPDIRDHIWAIGASSMGPVSYYEGALYIDERPNLSTCINIRDILEEKYQLPVYVNNDINTLLIAEKYFGNASEYNTFAVVGSSFGIGCSVMVNGQLYEGADGLGSEIGHITIKYGGKPCYCGNKGCLERYASVPAIVEWIQEEHKKENIPCEYNNWNDFLRGVEEKNPICLRGFDRMIEYLGAGLISLVNLFNPQQIFLGEYYAQAAAIMSEPLMKYINEHQFFPKRFVTEVKGSHFMGISPLIGPAAFAMHMTVNPTNH